MRVFSGIAALVVIGSAAFGQVMTPVPPASTPLEKGWTPPPPKAPAPPPPVEGPVAPVDVVVRDASGAIVLEKTPIEILAVRKLLSADAERGPKMEEKIRERAAQQDAMLVKNAKVALQTRDDVAKITDGSDWQNLTPLAQIIGHFSATPPLEQYIKTTGVLSPNQTTAFADSVQNWRKARNAELEKKVGKNDMAGVMKYRIPDTIRERCVEPFAELDRMLVALANDWTGAKARLGVTGDMKLGGTDAAKADAAAALLMTLPAEQQSMALSYYAYPVTAATVPGQPVGKPGEVILSNPPGKEPEKK